MAKQDIKVIIQTLLENKQFKAALKKQNAQLGTANKSMKTQGSFLSKIKGGYIAAAAAIGAAVASMNKFVKVALIQDKAQRTLAAAMKQAGTFTKEAFKHNLEYAASLQKLTTFGDEAILSVQKMLTNFGVEGDMLDKLTKSTLDLAAAKGMDLKAAADLVAKSVGSSTNALSRYGIEVTGTVGSTERMEKAVNNITKLFGGAAQAEAETYAGQIQQVKNASSDLMEVIGLELLEATKSGTKSLKDFVSSPNAMEGLRKATVGIIAAFRFLFHIVASGVRGWMFIFDPIIQSVKGVIGAIQILIDTNTSVGEKFNALKEISVDTFVNIKDNAIDTALDIGTGFQTIIQDTINAMEEGNRILDKSGKQAGKIIKTTTKLTKDEIDKRISYAKDLATATNSIGDNILLMEKGRLEQMDKNDKKAIKKQKSRMTEIARINKRLKQATAVIDAAAAILKTMASVPYPFNIPLAILQGIAGAAQIAAIEKTPIPEFARGSEDITRDQVAKVHRGERIIPAAMNVPGVSNADFVNSALQGLTLSGGGSNIYNNQNMSTSNSTTLVIENINTETGGVLEKVLKEADNLGIKVIQG
jgi:hypothetical protein